MIKFFFFAEGEAGSPTGNRMLNNDLNSHDEYKSIFLIYIWIFSFQNFTRINIFLIVPVKIQLHTKDVELKNIQWTLSPACRTIDNGDYGSNRVYPETCDLVKGQSYLLSCKSGNSNGWKSSFLVIESRKYCEDFTDGSEKTYNITISGNIFK